MKAKKPKGKKPVNKKKKPTVGFFSFTCCEGCEFTILFLDELYDIITKLNVQYFHLLKEKNRETHFDVAFIEGAITTKREIEKLKKIRKQSDFVVSLGACACLGGIPSMRNFLNVSELQKYVYSHHMLDDSVKASGIGGYIKVDYYMRGCPIIKKEFVNFVKNLLKGKFIKEFEGPVCNECPRRGKNCLLKEKKMCLGPMTNGGCGAICPIENIPCILCRGPIEGKNFAAEIRLFKSFGLDEKDIHNKLIKFKNVEL